MIMLTAESKVRNEHTETPQEFETSTSTASGDPSLFGALGVRPHGNTRVKVRRLSNSLFLCVPWTSTSFSCLGNVEIFQSRAKQ